MAKIKDRIRSRGTVPSEMGSAAVYHFTFKRWAKG